MSEGPVKKPVKRFIAGAVCPKCGELDKVVMFKLEGKQHRECVACGFMDEIHIQAKPRELETRVNVAEKDKHDTQTIKILNRD